MVKENVNVAEKFKDLYMLVFDEDGNTKACGRESCIDLINTASKLDGTVYYGNKQTGVMNTTNLEKLYKSISC